MKHKQIRFLVAPISAAALLLSVAACGSDAADSTAPSTTSAATSATTSAAAPSTTPSTTPSTAPSANPDAAGGIVVSDAWIREPAAGKSMTAVYALIANGGERDVTLVGASVPFEATVEIHETTMDADGAMSMQEVPDGFVVPAGATLTLEPGGRHIMLLGIDPADIVGEIEVTMIFDDGTELVVPAPVRGLGASTDSGMTATTVSSDMSDDMMGG